MGVQRGQTSGPRKAPTERVVPDMAETPTGNGKARFYAVQGIGGGSRVAWPPGVEAEAYVLRDRR